MISVEDGLLEQYEKLFLKKQQMLQECVQLQMIEFSLLGDLRIRRYEQQIESIYRRKEIRLYLQYYNRQETPDVWKIEETLKREMESYREALREMHEQRQAVRESRPVSEEEQLKIRKIYHELVHRMHPDLNPELEKDPEIRDLWEVLNAAYRAMDLEKMEEVHSRMAAYFSGNPGSEKISVLSSLPDQIEKLKKDIEQIQLEDPWLYQTWIYEPEKVKEKQVRLIEEIEELKNYNRELETKLESMKQEREQKQWMN